MKLLTLDWQLSQIGKLHKYVILRIVLKQKTKQNKTKRYMIGLFKKDSDWS